MKRIAGIRWLATLTVMVVVAAALTAQAANAISPATAVTKTFSFIGKPGSKTTTLLNINSLLINARCDASGRPVIFAFTSANAADIFGRIFDGFGRVHILHNTSFTKRTKGTQLSITSGDFDATGSILFESSSGPVVTVNLAFDNSATLGNQNVCTVFGSFIAT